MNQAPVSLHKTHFFTPGLHDGPGGVLYEVLEPRRTHEHTTIRGCFPRRLSIESNFVVAPLLLAAASDSWVDVENGMIILPGQNLLREAVVTAPLLDKYPFPSREELDAAPDMRDGPVIMPLASQRDVNYCRWWLDSVARLFVLKQSKHLRAIFPGKETLVALKDFERGFQQQTVDLLKAKNPNLFISDRGRILRGASFISPGITFRGGQEMAGQVEEFCLFLEELFPTDVSDPSKKFIYISRTHERMRRILNEDELAPGLQDMGFHIVNPSQLSLIEQIRLFRGAKIVAGPHGAAFTNLIFCRAGTRLVEIFPETGLHASAFLRIASLRKFDYYFAAGGAVDNRYSAGQNNPRNADIVVNAMETLSLIREATQGC